LPIAVLVELEDILVSASLPGSETSSTIPKQGDAMFTRRTRPHFQWLVLLLITSLLLVSCTVSAPAGGASSAATPADAAAGEAKVATFIFTQEFDTLSPIYTTMWFSSITRQIWNADAWAYDENNEPFPQLAAELPSLENGGISADGRTITVRLRDDIVWSDGEPITAADFVFTYEMITNPANAVYTTHPYDKIESIEAPDEHTVVTTFAEPFAPWLATLWFGVLPEHVLRPVFDAEGTLENAEWNLAPTVSAGPYVFAEWESGSFARFVRNDNYWGEPALIDEIFIRFVPDDASQVAALQAGDGDLGTFISYADIPALEESGVNIVAVPSGYNEGWYIYFGEETHPALLDLKVRQALALAFDRFSLVEDLLLGRTQPAATFWDNSPFVDPTIEPWPYDPERAKQLLDEAGWVDSNGDGTRDKDGVELVLTYGTTTREIRTDTQAVVQQELAEVGIGVELLTFESNIFFASYADGGPMATGQLDIGQWSTVASFPDPDSADFLCSEIPSDENPSGTNSSALCDEDLDALFQLQASQVDPATREQTFHQITRHIFDNVYWLGIWQDPDIWALSGRLTNVNLSGATPFSKIAEWDITE
jgi:peptide/nickel transport system substrate-binding protein